MNTALKHWREAATLILAAGHRLGDGLPGRTAPLVSGRGGLQPPRHRRFDYDVLMLQRSGKSGFMPNAYVFPGGVVDCSDFSSDWLEVFKPFVDSPNFGLRHVEQPIESRPPIFATDRLKLGSAVPGEVALRICALRETFEESGVLLVVSKREKGLLKSFEETWGGQHYTEDELSGAELTKWRALVNQNPSNFVQMCRELEVLPNIWALHEWANWLTPIKKYGATRFDTAFFMCCLQDIPHTLQDEREIEGFQWSTPSEILRSYQDRQLWIAPPQFYELSRMCRFTSLTDLHRFTHQRATEGCEQFTPVVVFKDEQYVSLLPGDKQYPKENSEQTGAEKNPDTDSALHRILISDPYTTTLQITIMPKYNHLLPVEEPGLSHDVNGQL
ncbi:acyl-coenzyme A diphosphatase NUDT19 [Menidia menidia]